MNRRQGAEGHFGLGGGMVSRQSRENLEKAEDLCRKKRPHEALPYLRKALDLDPENLDAMIQLAFLAPNLASSVKTLENAERTGRAVLQRELGDDCFDDAGESVGNFWMLIQTRPYMRVLQALVKLYWDTGRYDKACDTILEMMRLCPGDNMGSRFSVGTHLISCKRYADALFFCQQWLTEEANGKGVPPPRGGTAFKAPHRNTMAIKKEKGYDWTPTGILYSAALASFKHWGDCEQSRQYLKMAAKANPNVLLKVLGNVKKPSGFNNSPRSPNGPEDAQDYLYLSQDFWMEPDVWNWANDNPDVKAAVLKVCSRPDCGAREVRVAEYKRCSACHLVSYCSVACQKDDWSRHKPECSEYKKRKASVRAFSMAKAVPIDSPYPMFTSDMLSAMPDL